MGKIKKFWQKFRKVWAIVGGIALIIFVGWSLIAYQPTSEAIEALQDSEDVEVIKYENHWAFLPTNIPTKKTTGVLFFPGALVDPRAYAPITNKLAQQGYPAILVSVPMRCAFGGADGSEVMNRAHTAMDEITSATNWVIAGHSRGGAIASRFVYENQNSAVGLILIGTSHPRRINLASISIPVIKILGTNDSISPVQYSNDHKHLLPSTTQRIEIAGGNHSQFGYYGFQPGDSFASINREAQQKQMLDAIIQLLELLE